MAIGAMFLECRNLQFRYPGANKELFKDLTLNFDRPGFHSLFGPSGVGKSTLARILSGLLHPGKEVVRSDGVTISLYAHNLERLPGWSSIGQHLDRITPEHNKDKLKTLIEDFGLSPHLGKRFAQLSLGQKNRINFVRYLVQDFQVLISDECLANVDEKMRFRILISIKKMFPNLLFIYISHNVIEVANICDRIWVLRGPGKRHQAVLIQGQDCRDEESINHQSLQQTMLEIVNAA